MPNVFDNIENPLLGALQETLKISHRADFCVGYFNLRGWRMIDELMEEWQGGEQGCCRLLIGMHENPEEELRKAMRLRPDQGVDQGVIVRAKTRMAEAFRKQLLVGAPTNADEQGLRRLSAQLRAGKVVVKLFLRHNLHAKLYLLYQKHPIVPAIGYMGSSNLTLAGLRHQGELNVDVVEADACKKLIRWFEERWTDRWCLDISQELAEIIDESWAREEPILPYYIYLKMAYHLAEEARAGLQDFRIPAEFKNQLFDYQTAAVQIAAHHLNKRGGVLIGDVVGLGKTLMATALAKIMQDDFGTDLLVICPKNLVRMWQDYLIRYKLVGEVHSLSNVINELEDLRRYRLVIIDESHNLRNREGKRYAAIKSYIERNESKCILLSATPYNKRYQDLSAQLRLFLTEEQSNDLGIRPEKLLAEMGEIKFASAYQCSVRSLTAFEQSEHADDWRDLMRLYMVRRTRSFIQENYAQRDTTTGRKFLTYSDGRTSFFPIRVPRTVTFALDDSHLSDPYAQLYSDEIVDAINGLLLPRYGLGNYIAKTPKQRPNAAETRQLGSLSRAGKHLMGFCRTNLFKRLESGGPAFLQSVERHILRNHVFLHAIDAGLDLPLGTQDAELLDTRTNDEEEDVWQPGLAETAEEEAAPALVIPQTPLDTETEYRKRAAAIYQQYASQFKNRFKWIRPTLFNAQLKKDLLQDAHQLQQVLARCPVWEAQQDTKLSALIHLLTQRHPTEKVLIFTQFADTVRYLTEQLRMQGISSIEGVTGDSENTTELVWRFSPRSNEKQQQISSAQELRILIATDVLSEGQNLQDAAIVVNYDLPWAIIRLIQRAGRVDRIGQRADTIVCYSFLPAEGVERLLRLRERVSQRLQENAEVVGTDESFFEDEPDKTVFLDLYNEKSGILDVEADNEVDLASQAYQIWKSAIEANPRLKTTIEHMPNVVYSTRAHHPTLHAPEGVIVYMRTADGNDALALVNRQGECVTQSQQAILRLAVCNLDEPHIARPPEQHGLVQQGVERILAEETHRSGGQLGSPSGARFRTYERLKAYAEKYRDSLIPIDPDLPGAISDLYMYPLQESARETLKRQLRAGIDDDQLIDLVLDMRANDRLCFIREEGEQQEPSIICSLGLVEPGGTA